MRPDGQGCAPHIRRSIPAVPARRAGEYHEGLCGPAEQAAVASCLSAVAVHLRMYPAVQKLHARPLEEAGRKVLDAERRRPVVHRLEVGPSVLRRGWFCRHRVSETLEPWSTPRRKGGPTARRWRRRRSLSTRLTSPCGTTPSKRVGQLWGRAQRPPLRPQPSRVGPPSCWPWSRSAVRARSSTSSLARTGSTSRAIAASASSRAASDASASTRSRTSPRYVRSCRQLDCHRCLRHRGAGEQASPG